MLINNKEERIQEKIQEITGIKKDIKQQLCYDLIKNHREYKIKKILLISSSYDYFLLEEEGRLNTLFTEWCKFTKDEQPPKITHTESEQETIKKLDKEQYDLIIIFNKPQNTTIKKITDIIKEKTQTPVVLLYSEILDISKTLNDPEIKVDKFFTWNGDGKIILSIVHYFEDKKNLKHISEYDKKNIILLIEDSIQYYSSYLILLNEEIYNYLKKIITDELRCEQKTLRFKRRPFVLHAENIEDAKKFYEKYKDDILFIITDNLLEENKFEKKSGLKLVENISKEKPNIPIIIQSSEPIKEREIENKKIKIISKKSYNLSNLLRKFIKESIGPNELIFEDKKKKEKTKVRNIQEFQKVISNINLKTLQAAAKINKISKWIKRIGEVELAEKCEKIENEIDIADKLKTKLIEMLEDYNYSINQAAITSFSQKIDDPFVKISRIGKGALGGKARGIAFIAKILSKYLSEDMFPNLKITIPRSIVLSTDIFDIFMEHNNFSDIDFQNLSDERISAKFMSSSLPATILGDLRSFIQKTRKPIIVRSSGLLEDSLMQPFAGIYASMLLPNDSWETDLRFQEVCNSIKYVYSSTYFEKARTYIKNTPKHLGDEKMSVLIQELVGEKHDKYFYPTISGVAKSYNYYPQGPCKPEEGIVYLALGLGKSIVDGGSSYAFCPEKPKAPLFGTPKDYMKYSQNKFYALNLRSIYKFANYNEETSLDKLDLEVAKKHGVLEKTVSTYILQDDTVYPGIYDGSLIVDFGPIIRYNELPLSKAIKLLLNISEIALGYPVEIEFAVNISKNEKNPSELVILQIRNMISPEKNIEINFEKIPLTDTLITSSNILGHGVIQNIYDIVYVDQEKFDLSKSNQVVNKIREINNKLLEEKTPYILIGPGRWGSSDPWLGIPVIWSNISGAKAIIETPYKERPIDPSQGSHFFHDMIAAQVVYIITRKPEDIKWEWIKKQKITEETDCIKHIKTKKPIDILVDGKKGKGVIIKKQNL